MDLHKDKIKRQLIEVVKTEITSAFDRYDRDNGTQELKKDLLLDSNNLLENIKHSRDERY